MARRTQGRLELTWTNKDQTLLSASDGKYDYQFVDPTDPRAAEVRNLVVQGTHEGPPPDARLANLPEPTSGNLLITGDSMHVLDVLARVPEYRADYLGKIRLCYIDSPFNTQQTFKHYDDNLEHSIWLTMLRDRIRQVLPLLAEDGSIWVHLDDVEVHRCRVILDEEFGPKGFVGTIVWQKRYSRESRPAIGEVHDSILVYAKNVDAFKKSRNKIRRTSAKEYRNPDNDPRGPWRIIPFSAPGFRKNQMYDIVGPDGRIHRPPAGRCWGGVESVYEEYKAAGRIRFGITGEGAPGVLRYLDEDDGLTPWTWWPHEEVGHTDEAKKEIQALFGADDAFDTPKPERLMARIIEIATKPGEIVLDPFAGSGTTAAVAHKLGRRWVTCDLSEANIEKFAKPRLERVVAGDEPGGITSSTERVSVEEALPEGMTPDQAQAFTSALTKVAKHVAGGVIKDAPKELQDAVKLLKAAVKTKNDTTLNWHGGGGFTHLTVEPSMYELDEDGDLFLSDRANGEAWSRSVAGQLGFRYLSGAGVFCGTKGRQRLAVINGVTDEHAVNIVVESLGDGERAIIVTKALTANAQDLLTKKSPGSRIKKAPLDLFPKRTVR